MLLQYFARLYGGNAFISNLTKNLRNGMLWLFLKLLLKYILHLKQTFLHIYKNNIGLSTGYSVAHNFVSSITD